VQKRTARSVDEVIKIVCEARKEWDLDADEEIWFRGEDIRHHASTLQPKLYRHLPEEVRIVSDALLRKENDFHNEFQRCGAQLYDHEDVDDWDWYFLMQHHGAPTRLMDWSDGALMAVHFATKGHLNQTKGSYVYLLDPYSLNGILGDLPATAKFKEGWKAYREDRKKRGRRWPRYWDHVYLPGMHGLGSSGKSHPTKGQAPKITRPELPLEPMVLEFPQMTRRVAAQRSRFMVYGKDRHWLTRWAEGKDSRIWRISIPKNSVAQIKSQLRDAGITESVIFPDLDGLGREIDQLWDTLKKERRFNR